MKRTPLINRHLSALVAKLGHMDEVVVADAGLPTPQGVQVIDLSITPNLPTLFQVLQTLKSETVIEGMVHATDCNTDLAGKIEEARYDWQNAQGQPIALQSIAHSMFKSRTKTARAIIRTGDCTPYANVILISGVAF